MTAEYSIWISEPDGQRLQLLDQVSMFTAVRSANKPGFWSMVLPGNIDQDLLRKDAVIEILRKPAGGFQQDFITGFLRRIRYQRDQITISGPDTLDMLDSRVIAYPAESSQAAQSGAADDLLKQVVRENLGSAATDAARDLSAYLSVAANSSAGPTISKAFAWQNVLQILQGICDASAQAGTPLFFDVIKTGIKAWEFRTYTSQRGTDNSYPSGTDPVIFGQEYGNLEDPIYDVDYTPEKTYVYVGGQGIEDQRTIEEVSDTDRVNETIWSRREYFRDARTESDTDQLAAAGQAALNAAKPVKKFTGTLIDSDQARYGIEWKYGDKVSVIFRGMEFAGNINMVQLVVGTDGKEIISARVEI